MSPKSLTTQHGLGSLNRPAIKWALGIALVASILYLFIGAEDSLLDVRAARRELAQAETEVARLAAKNDSLQKILWRLENDPNYLEKIAREEYGLIKPGERVYHLAPTADSLASPNPRKLTPMPRHIVKTQAIVLRTYKMGETSKLVTLYTADFGKIKVIAKGARKPKSKFVGALELMTQINAVCYMRDERDLQILSDCDLVHLFPGLRHNLQRTAYGNAACELVERLTIDGEPNRRLYRCLEGVLQGLEEVDLNQAETLFWYFQLRLADAMGFRPELHVCASCRQPLQGEWLGFSSAAGGVLCAVCGPLGGTRLRGSIPRFLAALQDLRTYSRQAIPSTPPFRTEVRALLVGFLAFHGGGPPQLKALEFLEAVGTPTV